jgi:hypothetical protein
LCFRVENRFGQIKKHVRRPQYSIQQVLRRLGEQSFCVTKSYGTLIAPVTKYEHSNGPLLRSLKPVVQLKRLQTDKFTISLSAGNNCIMLAPGVPALVQNIVRERDDVITLVCTKFKKVTDALFDPLPSSKLSICQVESELPDLFAVTLKNVVNKCVCVGYSFSCSTSIIKNAEKSR